MRTTTRRCKGEQGLAVIMTGLLLIPLMTFAAFGVDLASWYSRISQIQKAADAASLAGTVWMPDLSRATTEANASLRLNGIRDGVDGMVVVIERGATPTSLRVEVTDTDADRVFSQVIRGRQSLTRHAEAEYNLPIPLGSPLNYFGGDATRTDPPPPATTWAVRWPDPFGSSRPPATAQTGETAQAFNCSVGNGTSAHPFGRWSNATTYEDATHTSSNRCLYTVTRTNNGMASSSVPPPDYSTRAPNTLPCRVLTNGTGTSIGRWASGPVFSTATTGSEAACQWLNSTSGPLPPGHNAYLPVNRPCRVSYNTADGWWGPSATGAYSTNSVPSGGAVATGNKLCRWPALVVDTTPPKPPNPIDSSRSPGFWALIEGPGTAATQGDAYTPRCYITANCGSVENASYRDPANPGRGYWYVVKVPPGLSGSINLQVFDASNNPSGSQTTLAGDSSINASNQAFETEYSVYRQTNPLDFSARTRIGSATADLNPGSCHWALGSEASFRGAWTSLCNLNSVSPGETYLINVRTNGTTGSGINGYALQACANGSCSAGVQPALYAYADMAMYNNIASGDATFYLAEVGPQYAGRTLVLELWDAGDASADATIYPMRPSPSVPKPVVNVPAGQCGYTASPAPNAVQTNSVGGATGFVYAAERPSDTSGICGIRSTIGSTRQFNGEWLRIRLDIPGDYTCTPGVNPETTAGSCWWGIKYNFTGPTTDVTTWQARIDGNPLQLTQ